MRLSSEILDEIALEGLDGVTIEALWTRLLNRKDFMLPPKDEHSKLYLWNIVKRLRDVEFYQLQEPREPLVIFDRWSSLEDELGMVMEPTTAPVEIYPHCLIADPVNKIQGSCSSYYTREDVTNEVRKLKLEEIFDKYGAERIVIVANQETRRKALMGNHQNPQLELTDFQYCCLERIGRSRYHGEVTQGKMGLQVLGVDTKTIYYFRKFLLKQKLITQQAFHMRTTTIHLGGRLMHLPRFYRLVKPKFVTLTESIINFLMTQPDYMCEVNKLKETLGIPCSLKKLVKMPEFQKYVRSDSKVPYRTVFPDADTKEWKHKSSDKERYVRVLYLVDPTRDAKEIQRKLEGDDDDDEDEDEETHSHGFLDQSRRCYDRPLVLQVLNILENAGPNGLSATELTHACGLAKLNMRTICKSLMKSNLISSFMADVARQRVTRYFVNSGGKLSDFTAQFTSEELKLSNLTNVNNKLNDVYEAQGAACSSNVDIEIESEYSTLPGDDNVSRVTVNETHNDSMELVEYGVAEKTGGDDIGKGNEKTEGGVVQKGEKVNKDVERGEDKKDEQGTKGDEERKEENMKIIETNSKVLQRPGSSKKSMKRPMNADKVIGSPSKKLKLKVKTVVDLNSEGSVVDTVAEPMDVTPESSPDKTNVTTDEEMSISEPSVSGETVSSYDFNIDIEITDDLNWLKVKGYLSKDVSRSCNVDGYRTVRSLKRWNLILETVQNHKVISNLKNLHTVINDYESKEGHSTQIDRKSLFRILYKMSEDRLIKVYKAVLKSGETTHEINFICCSSVTPDHPLIRSTIDLAKLKFSSKIKLQNDCAIKQENKSLEPAKQAEMVLTNKFDFSEEHRLTLDVPKFMRMRYLHIFIYYLVYGYEGSADLNQVEAANQIRASQGFAVDDLDSMSFIYVASANWKMFVPPLPQHREYKSGWALLADIILRLPLSMFLQLVRLPYTIPNLELYIDHPIKRHLLVKDLPVPIRNCLTFKRKYVFSISEVMTRLAYIGLVQMGPQSFKEKDHVYMYLNKNAMLLDTKPSRPGYHKVSEDITYEESRYYFDTMMDVERYWLDMWKICMHTKLGSRSCVVGTELILENIQDKPDMVNVLAARSREEVGERDVGYLPGDKLGAAGFDSALFSHLKRNWSFKPFPRRSTTVLRIPDKSSQSTKKPFKFAEGKNHIVYSLLAKRRKNLTVTARRQTNTNTNTGHRKQLLSKKPRVTVRHVKPKRNVKHRRPYYDQVDREALQRMNKLRVDWSKAEDKLLLLCKVVQLMIAPPLKTTSLGNMYMSTREILHKTFPSSRNKTSRACQRRANYMLRSQSTCHSLNLCIEELRHDSAIMETYGDLFEKLKAKHKNKAAMTDEWNMHFKNLFEILAKRYDNFSMLSLSSVSSQAMPDTLEEFYAKYNVIEPTKKVKPKHRFNSVESINDIYCAVINATIHSALCCSSDKTSWSYHLFTVYQQYPEKLLRLALSKTRLSLMVSLKRAWSRTKMRSGNYLPLTASPYRLSITYINMMSAKYTFDIFEESFDLLKKIVQSKQVEVPSATGGTTAGVVHMVTENLVNFEIGIPDQVIVLNPNIQEKDETYTRLMKRYQEILTNYKQDLLTTSCLFQKDNYSTINNIEDEIHSKDDDDDNISNNTIARTASRIALYLVRDSEEVGGSVPQDLQHVHDFFVVNSCSVVSNLKSGLTDDELQGITDMSEVENFLKQLKENVIFPATLMFDLDMDKISQNHFLNDRIDKVVKLLELAESEGNLGLMCDKISEEFGNSLEVKQILDELCKLKLLVCTGVVNTVYVHYRHVRPWLVHTYQNKRRERDNRPPMIGGVMELGEENMEENIIDKGRVEGGSNESNKDRNSRLLPGEDQKSIGGTDEDAPKEQKSDCYFESDMLILEHEEEEVGEGENIRGKGEEIHVVDVIRMAKKSGNKDQNDDNVMEVDCGKLVQGEVDKGLEENNLVEFSSGKEKLEEQEDKEEIVIGLKENNPVEGSFGKGGIESFKETNAGEGSSKVVHLTEEQTSIVVKKDEKEGNVEELDHGKEGGGSSGCRKRAQLDKDVTTDVETSRKTRSDSNGENLIAEASNSVRNGKDTDNRNLSQPIKVLMRPWVKVDGSLNRRVLDYMLSTVLSHIMLHPLSSLAELQERFLPALQPQHTRELAEFLIQIKCIRSFICVTIGKASLFSKPCEVVLKEATGLEPATELRYEANKDAIVNLGKLISTKHYNQGFLAMLVNK